MCGYARRKITNRHLQETLDGLGINTTIDQPNEELQHFYPAFGGNAARQLNGLIIREAGHDKAVDATWWFACSPVGKTLAVDNKLTTFNARNLEQPFWRKAIRSHRGIFVATGIGEGKIIEGKSNQYLVQSETPILLGCVYRAYENGCYSAAIITREPHPRFTSYHDKAFPLMLPHDKTIINLWLGDASENDPEIGRLLHKPIIYNDLEITRVKTFKDSQPLGETIYLSADTAT